MNEITNQFQPNYIYPPGDTLLEVLTTMGMSQSQLSERMGRPRKTISSIIQGITAITAETALQLELALGIPASFWSNLERQYQETITRLDAEAEWAEQSEWLNTFPVREMCQWNWIHCCQDTAQQVRVLLAFFGVASITQWRMVYKQVNVSFRQSTSRAINYGAVVAWLRKGELEAQDILCEPYNKSRFKEVLMQIRSLTREAPNQVWQDVIRLCATVGVAVTLVPALTNTGVCGATKWLNQEKALLQLSLRYKSDDHFWFSFFHEAGHILLHGKRDLFLESEENMEETKKEVEADRFASDFLIPPHDFRSFTTGRKFHYSKEEVKTFAKQLGISPGIVVGRLQHDELLPYTHMNDLKHKLNWDKNGNMVTMPIRQK